MNNTFYHIPAPYNEPILDYLPGSQERARLKAELKRQYNREVEIPLVIGGERITTNKTTKVVCPHEHGRLLAVYHRTGAKEIKMAVEAAVESRRGWSTLEWPQRAAIFLKMAYIVTTK